MIAINSATLFVCLPSIFFDTLRESSISKKIPIPARAFDLPLWIHDPSV